MTPTRFVHVFVAAVSCALLVSCGDDPVTPGGTYNEPAYRAELQSLDATFRVVCGAGPRDLYAVGDMILHHDGTGWNTIEPPAGLNGGLSMAYGFENGDLIVSDSRDIYLRSNGSWSSRPDIPNYPRDIWGVSSNDFYALSWDSLYHFDGTSWATVKVPRPRELNDIGGDESGQPVLCGGWGRIDRFNGTDWVSSYVDSMLHFDETAVTSTGRLFVSSNSGLLEIVNSTPVPVAGGGAPMSSPILCADGNAVFLAGRKSYSFGYSIMRFEDDAWQEVASGADDLYAFWAGHGNLIAGGRTGFVWCGNGSGGSRAPYEARGPIYCMVEIDGSIYAAGENAYRYDRGQWTDLDKGYITRRDVWDIDGRSPNNIYAVGDEMVLHYDGSTWTWVNSALNTRPNAIWVEPNGDVIAVADRALVEFDGRDWTKTLMPVNSYFMDVIGVDGLIVAVGDNGLIAMRRNGEWHITPPPTNDPLVALWAQDERHIYAASYWGHELCFFDGQTWDSMPILGSNLESVTDIWGSSPANLFVLDRFGHLLHFDGRTWSPEERVALTSTYALCGNGPELLVGGYWGSVSYRR